MKKTQKDAGFTILELLIATTVFSLILVVITTGILSFTRQYYKGVISSNTQNTARAIIDDVTRSIQFNTGQLYTLYDVSGHKAGYCIGEAKRYSFSQYSQVTDTNPDTAHHQHYHGLVTDDTSGCSDLTSPLPVAANFFVMPAGANEMLGAHMRLVKFDIQSSGNIDTVTVRVAYGDDDLLCSPSVNNSCNPTVNDPAIWGKDDLTCKLAVGSQFCAVSELSTTVTKRVN